MINFNAAHILSQRIPGNLPGFMASLELWLHRLSKRNLFNKHVQHILFVLRTLHYLFVMYLLCFYLISLIALQISAITYTLPPYPLRHLARCMTFGNFRMRLKSLGFAAEVTSNKKLNKFSDKLLQQHFFQFVQIPPHTSAGFGRNKSVLHANRFMVFVRTQLNVAPSSNSQSRAQSQSQSLNVSLTRPI